MRLITTFVLCAAALAGCGAADSQPTHQPNVKAGALRDARDVCAAFGIDKVRSAYGGGESITSVAAAYGAQYRGQFRAYAATGCAIGLRDR